MAVTIRELADAAGVSIATVSRVLNHKSHPVSEETRVRILALADELGYRPNVAARSLRTDRSSTIGIITDNIDSPHTTMMIRGIQDTVKQAGYICVVISADWDPEVEREAIHDLVSRSIDGIVFAETWHRSANETLALNNIPFVFVHRQYASESRLSVTPDEVYGAHLATQHLLNLGHRRIGYINGPEQFWASADRLRGYRETLAAQGIEYDPALVARGDWQVASGYAGANQILQANPRLTALFAGNDLMAAGAMYALFDAGLRVPDDVAVVGYDNREIARIFRPSMTTITLPLHEMGQAAAQVLLALLGGEEPPACEIKIQGRLMVRESCGADPALREPPMVRNPRRPPILSPTG
ncbi:MAG: LacI family DNA-binding transcriptional regulator [Anaerolineales bacterium]|nr:LacI family DNA-binding transcriptional regulator [Anaerolineales bacterium]